VARRNGKIFITGNSGFPKNLNLGKAIDREAGAEREIVGHKSRGDVEKAKSSGVTMAAAHANRNNKAIFGYGEEVLSLPATPEAKQWSGFGTALKPSHEPICKARKPLSEGTVAANVLKHACGGLNIDGCRIGTEQNLKRNCKGWASSKNEGYKRPWMENAEKECFGSDKGRWPANLVLSHFSSLVMILRNDIPEEFRAIIKEYYHGYTRVQDLRERKNCPSFSPKCRPEILQQGMQSKGADEGYDSQKGNANLLDLSEGFHSSKSMGKGRSKKILQQNMQESIYENSNGAESTALWEKTQQRIQRQNICNEVDERNLVKERTTSDVERRQMPSERICFCNDRYSIRGTKRNGAQNEAESDIHITTSTHNGNEIEKSITRHGDSSPHQWHQDRQSPRESDDRKSRETFTSSQTNGEGSIKTHEGKSKLEVLAHDIPDFWMPFFIKTNEYIGCKRLGVKKVKGAGIAIRSKSSGKTFGSNSPRPPLPDLGYTDTEGFEEIESWDCVDGCPVKELDRQSGITSSSCSWRPPDRGGTGNSLVFKHESGEFRGFEDSGGASRFFKTVNFSKEEICEHANFVTGNSSLKRRAEDFALNLVAIAGSQEETMSGDLIQPFMSAMLSQSRNNGGDGIERILNIGEECLQGLLHMLTEQLNGNPVNNVEIQSLINTIAIMQNLLSIDGYVEDVISYFTEMNMEAGEKVCESPFRYCAKASPAERDFGLKGGKKVAGGMSARADGSLDGHVTYRRNTHATVKPLKLMEWLVRLVTPPQGLILDPFCGSGTTGCAAVREGFGFVGIDKDAESCEIARARIGAWSRVSKTIDLGLA